MKLYMRAIQHPSPDRHGNGRNTYERERRALLLAGYSVVEPVDEGEAYQSEGYDVLVRCPALAPDDGVRFALIVRLEPELGEEWEPPHTVSQVPEADAKLPPARWIGLTWK